MTWRDSGDLLPPRPQLGVDVVLHEVLQAWLPAPGARRQLLVLRVVDSVCCLREDFDVVGLALICFGWVSFPPLILLLLLLINNVSIVCKEVCKDVRSLISQEVIT